MVPCCWCWFFWMDVFFLGGKNHHQPAGKSCCTFCFVLFFFVCGVFFFFPANFDKEKKDTGSTFFFSTKKTLRPTVQNLKLQLQKQKKHTSFQLVFYHRVSSWILPVPAGRVWTGGTCHLSAPAQLPSKKTTKIGLNRILPLKSQHFNRKFHLNQPSIFRGYVNFMP